MDHSIFPLVLGNSFFEQFICSGNSIEASVNAEQKPLSGNHATKRSPSNNKSLESGNKMEIPKTFGEKSAFSMEFLTKCSFLANKKQ